MENANVSNQSFFVFVFVVVVFGGGGEGVPFVFPKASCHADRPCCAFQSVRGL